MDLVLTLASIVGAGLALVAILLLFGIFLRLGRIALYLRRLTEQQTSSPAHGRHSAGRPSTTGPTFRTLG
jgi:hypothetical protein